MPTNLLCIIRNLSLPELHYLQAKPKQHYNFLNVLFIKMKPFSSYHSFKDSWHSIEQRMKVDWGYFWLAFLQELQEINRSFGSFINDFRSNSSHTSSMGFNSADCTGQDISWRTCCSSLFLMTSGRVYLYTFGHYLAWLKALNPQATFQVRLRDAGLFYDSWWDSICSSTGANSRFCIGKKGLPLHDHNKASHILYGWCDTVSYSSFINSSLHLDPLIRAKPSKFDSSVQTTLFHCSIVQS